MLEVRTRGRVSIQLNTPCPKITRDYHLGAIVRAFLLPNHHHHHHRMCVRGGGGVCILFSNVIIRCVRISHTPCHTRTRTHTPECTHNERCVLIGVIIVFVSVQLSPGVAFQKRRHMRVFFFCWRLNQMSVCRSGIRRANVRACVCVIGGGLRIYTTRCIHIYLLGMELGCDLI